MRKNKASVVQAESDATIALKKQQQGTSATRQNNLRTEGKFIQRKGEQTITNIKNTGKLSAKRLALVEQQLADEKVQIEIRRIKLEEDQRLQALCNSEKGTAGKEAACARLGSRSPSSASANKLNLPTSRTRGLFNSGVGQ